METSDGMMGADFRGGHLVRDIYLPRRRRTVLRRRDGSAHRLVQGETADCWRPGKSRSDPGGVPKVSGRCAADASKSARPWDRKRRGGLYAVRGGSYRLNWGGLRSYACMSRNETYAMDMYRLCSFPVYKQAPIIKYRMVRQFYKDEAGCGSPTCIEEAVSVRSESTLTAG